MSNKKITPLLLDTLSSLLEKSQDIKLFQTLYVDIDGEKKDALEGGNLSCAFYVSGILAILGLIDRFHGTVLGTEQALIKAGWVKTSDLELGNILIWGKAKNQEHDHLHLGFYLGHDEAISNIWQDRVPKKHHFTFGLESDLSYRPILAAYHHPSLS